MIACAAISARALVEAAAADGVATVALDLFGDVDTCRHASAWHAIGDPATLRIEPERLLAVLHSLARQGRVQAWVAGSGFDGAADLLAEGGRHLPLLGTPAAAVRRVRDPREFFGRLDALAIDHPEVRFDAPTANDGWLTKDAGSCGGWGVRRWTGAPAPHTPGTGHHWQRQVAGEPMSATFVANGRDAVVFGVNRQIVGAIGGHPWVFRGVVGPVPVDEAVRQVVTRAVNALTAELGVVGLASLDFLLDGHHVQVLELNPRPPASLALYGRPGGGAFRAHLDACRHGALPSPQAPALPVRGQAIVYAPRAMLLGGPAAALIAAWPGACDLPRAGSRFSPGEPVCSVSAQGPSADAVVADLEHQSATLRDSLEPLT